MRFEPSGLTNDEDIRVAKSIINYIFRWFGKKLLTTEQQEAAGILSARGQGKARAAVPRRRDRGAGGPVRSAGARPDGPVQRVGGRRGVRQVRRPDDQDGQLRTPGTAE